MIGKIFRVSLVASVAAIACTAVFAADLVDNPRYQDWAKYKPGTFIRTRTEVLGASGRNMSIFRTSTLKEVTPEKVVLEMKSDMDVPGMPPSENTLVVVDVVIAKIETTELARYLKIEQLLKNPGVKVINKGTEDMKIGDKTYKCNWHEMEFEEQGRKLSRKYWSCDNIPDELVRSESKLDGGSSSTMLVVFEAVK